METAFIKTAGRIYDNIKAGLYDPTREGNGVRLGSMAAKPGLGGKGAGPGKQGSGCC